MFTEFWRRLGNMSAVRVRDGAVEVTSFEGVPVDPAVRMVVTSESLMERLRGTADDAHEVFPSKEPLIAALQLLLVHVEEAVLTRKAGQDEITINGRGLHWRPSG